MRIFVLGNGRSGSSMLGMILGSHPMITNVGEAYNNDSGFITEAKRKLIKKEGLCGVCGKECDFWVKKHDIWKDAICVDTSKMVSWARKFSTVGNKYVRVTRSVYDRLGSFKHTKGRITKEIVENWVNHEGEITRFLSGLQVPHHVIKYEDLANKRGLKELMKYLMLDPIEDMWDFWKTRHHPIRGNHKTNLLVKIHHGLVDENSLGPKDVEFMEKIGFNIRHWDRSGHLTGPDLDLIEKCGAAYLNAGLGYGD